MPGNEYLSSTQGYSSYTIEHSHYEQVPAHITQMIIAEQRKKPKRLKPF
ncbi:MAG TPA: hypothetical protein VMW64_10605 [Dehalococcoidia bacterium]|nr:hypothetical protein [Dehalococcoidia bacterium]